MNSSRELEGLLEFLYLCPVGLIRTRLNGAIDMINPKAAQLLLPIARTTGKLENLFDVLQDYAPEVRNLVSDFPHPHGLVCEYHRIDTRKNPRAQAPILAATVIKLHLDPPDLMVVVEDITRLVQQEQALRDQDLRLQAILDGVRDYAIYSLDAAGKIESWNRSAERVEGFRSEDVIGRDFGVDYPPESREPHLMRHVLERAAVDGWHEDEGWRIRQDGERFWANTMVSVMRESDNPASRVQGFSVVTRDITDRKHAEDELRRMASTDYLTGAFNRRYFFETGPALLKNCARQGKPASLIMLDADKFKLLNDTFGHEFGDQALRVIARVCTAMVAPGDIVARFGGEEFVILLFERDQEAAAQLAEGIRARIAADCEHLTASFGVSRVEEHLDVALRAADDALYRAKDQGRNRVVLSVPVAAQGTLPKNSN